MSSRQTPTLAAGQATVALGDVDLGLGLAHAEAQAIRHPGRPSDVIDGVGAWRSAVLSGGRSLGS